MFVRTLGIASWEDPASAGSTQWREFEANVGLIIHRELKNETEGTVAAAPSFASEATMGFEPTMRGITLKGLAGPISSAARAHRHRRPYPTVRCRYRAWRCHTLVAYVLCSTAPAMTAATTSLGA